VITLGRLRYTAILIILILLLGLIVPNIMPVNCQLKKIGIDVSPRRVKGLEENSCKELLNYLVNSLTEEGYTVKLLEEITPKNLEGLDALVLGLVGDVYSNEGAYTEEEIEAISNWFKEGGKFIWIAVSSNYTDSSLCPKDLTFKIEESNKILQAINSHLRFDKAIVEDPDNNAGEAYIIIVDKSSGGINDEGKASKITEDIDKILFYSSIGIAGYKDNEFVNVENIIDNENIFWLCRTGPHARVITNAQAPPNVYTATYEGRLYVAVAEEVPVISDLFTIVYSKVLVTGNPIIGDKSLVISEYNGIKLEGLQFVLNVFKWGTEIRAEPNTTGYIIIGAIVIIVVVAMTAYTLRKGKRKSTSIEYSGQETGGEDIIYLVAI